jgi:hypothetical protein
MVPMADKVIFLVKTMVYLVDFTRKLGKIFPAAGTCGI